MLNAGHVRPILAVIVAVLLSCSMGAVAYADRGQAALTASRPSASEPSLSAGDASVLVAQSSKKKLSVRYRVQSKKTAKWSSWRSKYRKAGSTSARKARPIGGLSLKLKGAPEGSGISYQLRTVGGKVKPQKSNGAKLKAKKDIEAVSIYLTGELSEKYVVMYRVYVRGIGWSKRTFDGDWAGTYGDGLAVQAVRVKLVKRNKVSGWLGYWSDWSYYKKGKLVRSKWIKTTESPIDDLSRKPRRYWIDADGRLAVGRMVNPGDAGDRKARYKAYATKNGYVMTSQSAWLDGEWLTANRKGKLRVSKNRLVQARGAYVKWAVDTAADDSHGYSQVNRWGPDYDCSSFVLSSLRAAGIDVGEAEWTGNMLDELTQHGFQWHTDFSELEGGDILLGHNDSYHHTEIYLGCGRMVGGHRAEDGSITGEAGDQTGNELSVIGLYTGGFDGFLRYVG